MCLKIYFEIKSLDMTYISDLWYYFRQIHQRIAERLNSLVSAEQDNPDLLSVPSTSASTSANTARVRPHWSDHRLSNRSKHIYVPGGLPNCSTMPRLSQKFRLIEPQASCKSQVDASSSFLMADKNVKIWWKSGNREYWQPRTWHLVIPITWCQIFLKWHRTFL